MATVLEVKGSRREWEDNKFLYGETLWVATTVADAGLPVIGTTYFTDADNVADTSDITGRICVSRNVDLEVIPDIAFVRAVYRAFKAFAALS